MRDIDAAIEARSKNFTGRGRVHWITHEGQLLKAPASPALLDKNLFEAGRIRGGNHDPRQRNYHGMYYFSQTGKHVWHESLLEAKSLTGLDLYANIDAIASQPCRIEFADGTTHFPDYLALHTGGHQVLYDVKPESRITDPVIDQFARTLALCDRVGWGYSILTELSPQEQLNVTYVSYFKHPQFHPGPEAVARLLDELDQPKSFLDAARALHGETLPDARASLLHLIWQGTVQTDLGLHLGDNSIIERNSHANQR